MNPFFLHWYIPFHIMKLMKKLKLIVWPTIYLAITGLICLSLFNTFRSGYYSMIFVNGTSMLPTLNNSKEHPELRQKGYVDFGRIDTHEQVMNHLKRFDVIVTFYPWSSTDYEYSGDNYKHGQQPRKFATYKIKRVIGLPFERVVVDNTVALKETITITSPNPDIGTVTYGQEDKEHNVKAYPFTPNRSGSKVYRGGQCIDITLSENEYFVMGDNWESSSSSDDCLGNKHCVYRENMTGVLVSIDGLAEQYDEYTHYFQCQKPSCKKQFSVVTESSETPNVHECPRCGYEHVTYLEHEKEELIRDLHYFEKRYFL